MPGARPAPACVSGGKLVRDPPDVPPYEFNLTAFNDADQFKFGKNFALYATGDYAAIVYSNFYWAQDTIYTGYKRVYLWGIIINSSSDFLYRQGSAVWENCIFVLVL